MICNKCGRKNKNTNIRCEFCSNQLIDVETYQQSKINDVVILNGEHSKASGCIIKLIVFMSLGPFLLAGILFFMVGLFATISEENQIRDYEKTTGVLKGYTSCEYDDGSELCRVKYEYQVNEKSYTVSPNSLGDMESFKSEEVVYYNPNNPQESIIRAGWHVHMIFGGILTIVIGFIIVKTLIFLKPIKSSINKK